MDQTLLTTRDVVGMYRLALEDARDLSWLTKVTNLFKSDQALETYPFIGQVPAMREWLGGRSAKGFTANSLSIANKHYEATIEIALRDLRRDKTDQLELRITELANQGPQHWASLVTTLLLNGDTTVCYDGQYFFDTDHSEGSSGSQSNKISVDISAAPTQVHGVVAAPSVEEMQFAILQGIQGLMGLKDNQGRPMNQGASSFTVLAPTGLWLTAAQAVSAVTTVNSAAANLNPNVLTGLAIDVALNAELTWTDSFTIHRTDSPMKAIIRQEETMPQIKVKDETSEYAFDNDAIQVGIDSWRNGGYGFWQRAAKVILT